MQNSPLTGLLGLFMMLQLVVLLVLVLGGLYALYCLSRAATGLDRLASAVELWVQHETERAKPTAPLPGFTAPPVAPDAPFAPVPPAPPAQPNWMHPIELPVEAKIETMPIAPTPIAPTPEAERGL